ncbi:ammonium transporter [Corynebacterium sp. NML 120412]|uniref:ammonium transporter n=1 Tax=Corynebacterium sp. NML 120412 TaxID=2029401 RepID=UPI001177AF63|nr:ammonium transporter [Corynebacterium sp. NML 120412]
MSASLVLDMMVTSFAAMAVVPVVYVLWGWSASYAGDDIAGIVATPLQAFGVRGPDR